MTLAKFNSQNERIKRRYFTDLAEAEGKAAASVNQVAASIAEFEVFTKWRDFKKFHVEQAKSFKAHLAKQCSKATGKPLAIATIHARQMRLKAFFKWLAGQPGYKSRISYSDADYFNSSGNNRRIAETSREMPYPSLEQVLHVLRTMPTDSDFQRRDRAMVACTLLTGTRDDALASLSIKHFDFTRHQLFQDAREVRTKRRKTMLTDFFAVGDDVEQIVKDWIDYLTREKLFGPNDPAFPPAEQGIDSNGNFAVTGLRRTHWQNADGVRKAFKTAFEAAGLPAFHPHSLRHTLAVLGEKNCPSVHEWKLWSVNLGHSKMMTTILSYGAASADRKAEVFRKLREEAACSETGKLDKKAVE